MDLTCPKCRGAMRTYERNGVHVDQCTECRGIFLDRGELEKLVDAENAWHGETPTPAKPASGSAAAPAASGGLAGLVGEVLQQAKAAQSSSHGSRQYDPRYGHKKKKSFMDELFG